MLGYSFIVLFAFRPAFSLCREIRLVQDDIGSVVGTVNYSRKGFEFYSFRGMKYAEAPVRDLRFKPPVPYKPSGEGINATEDGPVCHQPQWGVNTESEDCLWVNVFTRYTSGNIGKLLPVLVYIHGGSFAFFIAQSLFHGPEYLLDHEIVLVTVNYRLGTLGFLSTGDEYAPGNYGMKDQVEALRWVQRYIKSFGGDPDRVTISGQSAGGASIGLHLLSPMSRGLFHRAIMISGSATINWAVDENPMELAEKQATLLNCPTKSSENIVNCIKGLEATDVAEMYDSLKGWNGHPIVIISPVVETEDYGIERFLTKHPLQSFAEGNIADVPVIIGTIRDEYAELALPIVQNETLAAELSAYWNEIAPVAFIYDRDDDVSRQLREFYLGSVDQPITNDSYDGLSQLFADATITAETVRSAKLLADKITSPVYLYQFNYRGSTVGLNHSDDLYYLFYDSYNYQILDTESEDAQCADRLTTLWKNFVELGNPTPEPEDVLNNVTWVRYSNEDPAFLNLDRNLTLVKGLYFEERMSFWEKLFPLQNPGGNARTRSGVSRSKKTL